MKYDTSRYLLACMQAQSVKERRYFFQHIADASSFNRIISTLHWRFVRVPIHFLRIDMEA